MRETRKIKYWSLSIYIPAWEEIKKKTDWKLELSFQKSIHVSERSDHISRLL
jgi:hypothetical protein